MSFTLNSAQLVVNCRRIVSYGLTDLVADDCNTLKRSAFKPLYQSELHDFDSKCALPKANATVEDIAPAVLATLSGIWSQMTFSSTTQFTMIQKKLFETVPSITTRPYADVAAVVREHEFLSQNENIRELADKIIRASN